jgi:hypothetical protein
MKLTADEREQLLANERTLIEHGVLRRVKKTKQKSAAQERAQAELEKFDNERPQRDNFADQDEASKWRLHRGFWYCYWRNYPKAIEQLVQSGPEYAVSGNPTEADCKRLSLQFCDVMRLYEEAEDQ